MVLGYISPIYLFEYRVPLDVRGSTTAGFFKSTKNFNTRVILMTILIYKPKMLLKAKILLNRSVYYIFIFNLGEKKSSYQMQNVKGQLQTDYEIDTLTFPPPHLMLTLASLQSLSAFIS